jgi:hypothetical protein
MLLQRNVEAEESKARDLGQSTYNLEAQVRDKEE